MLLDVIEVNECGVCIKRMTVAKADNGLGEADDEKKNSDEKTTVPYISSCVSVFCTHGRGCCISEGYGKPFCPSSVHLSTSRC